MAASCRSTETFDVVLLGGGLQNCLVALALLARRPDARVAIVERGARLGGNHTWSFHAADVPDDARSLVDPLVVARFGGYDVAFPGFARSLESPYSSITSERLHQVVTAGLAASAASRVLCGSVAIHVEADGVTLESGARLRGDLVVDSRGPSRGQPRQGGGYQKFVGLELGLSDPIERMRPLLMDATVPQTDGLRFFYVIPFDERRVLVEETFFSDTPVLDGRASELSILKYAESQGMRIGGVLRREQGVLPMPARVAPPPAPSSPLIGGYAGGWFHPATGYSFPAALRLALHVAEHAGGDLFGAAWRRLVHAHRTQVRFAAWLNRLLFGAMYPELRYHALERFYRSDEETIARFYALRTTRLDRLGLVCGRPPRGLRLPEGALRSGRREASTPATTRTVPS